MSGRKTISNTISVTTVEDGKDGTMIEEIFRRTNTNSTPSTPSSVNTDGSVPSGWSATPVGVTDTYKYEWRCRRTKQSGTWGAWSTPVISAKWSDDGKSFDIKGKADGIIAWGGSLPTASSSNVGQIYLRNDNSGNVSGTNNSLDYSVCESVYTDTYAWVGKHANIGDTFMYQGHMWQKLRDTATSSSNKRWDDQGQIQGEKGDDGDSIEEKTIYTISDSQPSTPTGTSPAGWLTTPLSAVFDAVPGSRSGFDSFGYANDGRRKATGGEEGEAQTFVDRLTFTTKDAGQVIAIEIEASTESYFDYIFVAPLDTEITAQNCRPYDDLDEATDLSRFASGDEKKIVLTTVPAAGAHYLDIVFTKDISDFEGEDTVWYRLLTNVWLSEGKLKNGALTGTWSAPQRWGGAVKREYSLLPSHGSLSFHRNALDELTPSSYNVYCGYKVTSPDEEKKGNATGNRANIGPRWLHIYRRIQGSNGSYGNWNKHSSDNANGVSVGSTNLGIEFALSTSPFYTGVSDSNIVERIFIPVLRDGQKGTDGATGRMYYPAGEYNAQTTYTRTATACPMVHYKVSGETVEYWYLNADSSAGTAPSDTAGNPWKKAENFGMVITEALFAAFAKLGSFIVSGDFFFSQYGILFTSSSDTTGTVVNTLGQTYNGQSCYTYFRSADPMAEKPSVNQYPKFRPTKVINALTGQEYMAGGNVRIENNAKGLAEVTIKGTIMATNLYRVMSLCLDGSTYVLNQEGKPCPIYYCRDLTAMEDDVPGYTAAHGITVGSYTDWSELADSEVGEPLYNGFIRCTGNADIVMLLDPQSSATWTDGNIVFIPRPQDYPGKTIEIRHTTTLGRGNAVVKTVAETNDFAKYPIIQNGSVVPGGGTDANPPSLTMAAGEILLLYSNGSYWFRV